MTIMAAFLSFRAALNFLSDLTVSCSGVVLAPPQIHG
jgi:hypothetical protein